MSDLWLPETDSPVQAALSSPQLAPLQDSLTGSPDAMAVKRMWERIESRHEPNRWRWVGRGVAAATLVACAVVFSLMWRAPAPLQFEEGGTLTAEYAAQTQTRLIALNDGSRIKLHEDAQLSLLNNERGVFTTAVRSGRVEFHVKPGGKRRWVVDAGALSVEVIGTVFSVERSERGASVEVQRGIVRVRGDVPGGEVELRAGDSVSVGDFRRSVASLEVSKKEEAIGVPASHEAVKAEPSPPSPEAEKTKANPVKQHATAQTLAPKKTVKPSLDQLMARADTFRKQGKAQQASKLFARVVQEAGASDPRRGIAALSFARTSGDSVATASALELGLPSMPGSLREPALARLLSAYQAAGQEVQIRRVAHLYLIEFPQGPRSQLAKKLANRP